MRGLHFRPASGTLTLLGQSPVFWEALFLGKSEREFIPPAYAELDVTPVQVPFDGPHRDHELLGNLAVGEPLDRQLHNVTLAACEVDTGDRGHEWAFAEAFAEFLVAFFAVRHRLPRTAPLPRRVQDSTGPGIGLTCQVYQPCFF